MVVHATNKTGSSSDDWIYYTFTLNYTYTQYSAMAQLHHLQFTVAHALGFPVSISRLLATDLYTGITEVSRNNTLPIPLQDSHT
jgi:hypothetical protein